MSFLSLLQTPLRVAISTRLLQYEPDLAVKLLANNSRHLEYHEVRACEQQNQCLKPLNLSPARCAIAVFNEIFLDFVLRPTIALQKDNAAPYSTDSK